MLAGVVVNKSNRLQVELRVALQFACDSAPCPPGPNYQSIEFSRSTLRTFRVRANCKARPPHKEHCEYQINRKHRPGIPVHVENQLDHPIKDYRASKRCFANIQRIAHSRVATPSTEKTKRVEDEQIHTNKQSQCPHAQRILGHIRMAI